MTKHYAFVLTINNPRITDTDAINQLARDRDLLAHMVVGNEGYSLGRTPHYQMAVCFKVKKSWKEVKAMFSRAHIEQLRYDYSLASAYCEKEGLYQHYGSLDEAKTILFHDALAKVNRTKPDSVKVASKAKNGGLGAVLPPSPFEALGKPLDQDYGDFYNADVWELRRLNKYKDFDSGLNR